MEVGKSQNVIGQQKTCYKASHVCAAEGSSKSVWGIQKVHFSPTRWQHFFATKKGWGVHPWGYLQNPFHRLRVRHSYAYFETTIFQICSAVFPKKWELSILAFHKYYITSLSPVFHTGFFWLIQCEGVNHPGKESIP